MQIQGSRPIQPGDAVTGGGQSRAHLALVGLDGATFSVLDPLMAAGVMPALAAIAQRGIRTTLRSTVPTYTPPAWVSMATGVNPGRHGIYGFLANTPQEPAEIVHSGLIGAPPIWRYLEALGVRSGIFNLPMSYPPSKVAGFMISGGLAAGWTDTEMPNFSSDVASGMLVSEISKGSYPLDTVVSYENDWRSTAVADRITRVQKLRRTVLAALLEKYDVDLVFAVFEGVDRIQHLHYQYIVECSEWYGRPEAQQMRERAFAYFQELDQVISDLVSWAGDDGHVVVVSDHGFGPWEKTLNVNLLLEQWGYLRLPIGSKLTRMRAVTGTGQRVARRVLPRRMLHAAKSRVGQRIVWEDTKAFSSHVAEQGIHINSRSDLPSGVLNDEATTKVETELIDRLNDFKDPADGLPVVDTVVRRTGTIHGPHANRAPHLFPFCRDQRYELSDSLVASSPLTDHRDRPWGYHHKNGILFASGPGAGEGEMEAGLDIVDVLPTIFHLADLPVPAGLDGGVNHPLLSPAADSRPVDTTDLDLDQKRSEDNPYSPEEEQSIEDALRGLGYMD